MMKPVPVTLQEKVDHLSRLGPDVLLEFLAQLDEHAGCGSAIKELLDCYQSVSVGMVRKAGARRQ